MTPCSGRRCATPIGAWSRRAGPTRCGRCIPTSGSTILEIFPERLCPRRGLRIYHLLLSPSLAGRLVAAGVERANEVIVGTEDEIYSRRGLINRTTLTVAEIGETIVNILEHRLAAMRAQLEKRGSEDHGESR
jgi:hypothetical protein